MASITVFTVARIIRRPVTASIMSLLIIRWDRSGIKGIMPDVLGGVPGQVRGPGHHSIVTGPDNRTDYVVYHAWDPSMKTRWMCVDKLKWTPEGPKCDPTWTATKLSAGRSRC